MRKKNFYSLQRLCVVKRRSMRQLALALLLPATPLFAQRVNISVSNAPLERVCKELEKQTGYYFVYPQNMRDSGPQISVQLKDADVNTALQRVFESTPYRYEVTDKVVSVNTAPVQAAMPQHRESADTTGLINLKGQLFSGIGTSPLANASVYTTVTKRTALTDVKGMFELKGVKIGEEVVITYVGYKASRKKIEEPAITMMIYPADNQLDNVVVKAYGVTNKRFNVSNIVSVSGKELQDIPVANPLLALAGRVPGLEITQMGASPSAPMSVSVRGRTTINNNLNSEPLFIIDGVPQTILNLSVGTKSDLLQSFVSTGLDQSGLAGMNQFFGISAKDIESISVLKDAGATAIYGSRGANGVIIIKTRKPKIGDTQFDMSLSDGIRTVVRYQDMLDTKQFLAMRRQAYAHAGWTPNNRSGTQGYAPELFLADTIRNQDWQRYVFGKLGHAVTANIGMQGGSEWSSFRLSGTYTKQTDVMPSFVNSGDRAASVSMTLNNNSRNDKLRTTVNLIYRNTQADRIGSVGLGLNTIPYAPDPLDSLGNLNYAAYKAARLPYNFAAFKKPTTSISNNISSSFTANYNIVKGLDIVLDLGYGYAINNTKSISPVASLEPKSVSGTTPYGTHSESITQISNLNVDPRLVWNKAIGDGVLTATGGVTYQSNSTRLLSTTGSSYATDDMINSLAAAPAKNITDGSGQYKYAGALAEINYIYAQRYILNLTGRRDGSSRFGAGHQFGNFGAVSAGWILSEEPWAKKSLPKAITFFKPKFSYGVTGSDGVGDYQYLSQWAYDVTTITGGVYGAALYNGVQPIHATLAANDQFHWQSNMKLDLGLEMELWHALGIELGWYRDRCNDQLLAYPLPIFTGFSSITANSVANVQNSGWTVIMNATLFARKDFSWSAGGNLSIARNKLLSYPDLAYSPYAGMYQVGKSLNLTYLLHHESTNAATGKRTYTDTNHDGVYNTAGAIPGTGGDDRVVALDLTTRFSAGFNMRLRYKTWSLAPTFTFEQRYGTMNYTRLTSPYINISEWEYRNSWTPTHPNALLPAITADVNDPESLYFTRSDASYQKINIFRLNNLVLNWSLPAKALEHKKLKNVSFNLAADNLWLLTNYKGSIDPNLPYYSPSTRTVTIGSSISF